MEAFEEVWYQVKPLRELAPSEIEYLSDYLHGYFIEKSITNGLEVSLPVNGKSWTFVILLPSMDSGEQYIVKMESKFRFHTVNDKLVRRKSVRFVGYENLVSLAETQLSNRKLEPMRLIVHGPSGTGKTLLLKQLLCGLDYFYFDILEFDVSNEKSILKQMKDSSFMFVENIDKLDIAKEPESGSLLTYLLDLLDARSIRNFVATAEDLEQVDERLRRRGRLENWIELYAPDERNRLLIVQQLCGRFKVEVTSNFIKEFNFKLNGFLAADIERIFKEAALNCLRRNSYLMEEADLMYAAGLVKPTSLRNISVEVPKVYWQDIGGMEETKQMIKEAVIWPISKKDLFLKLGVQPPRGILLYGPPGCSKTLLAKAIATESSMNFLAIKGPELLNPYLGQSEKNIRQIFSKARSASPCVVFFDEIDAISASGDSSRGVLDRVVSQLLVELDGIKPTSEENAIVIIAATNKPDLLSPALLRPGRFDRLLYVPPPDKDSRRKIFEITLEKARIASDVDFDELALLTDGFSGAEVVGFCREAVLKALEEDFSSEKVSKRNFQSVLGDMSLQITPEMLEYYRSFRRKKS